MVIPSVFKTHLAWIFSHVLEGTFKRNKKIFAHHNYPILAPLPSHKSRTRPLEDAGAGPFIYFVTDRSGTITYIGKSEEENVLLRWARPGIGGPFDYYWTHSTTSGGCVFEIAKGILAKNGPYSLRYATLESLIPVYGARFGITKGMAPKLALKRMEDGMIDLLTPLWNVI